MTAVAKKRRWDNSGGFTLLEVLVALSLIAITVTGVFSLQLTNIRVAKSSQFDTRAILSLEAALASIASRPLAEITELTSDSTPGAGALRWTATVSSWDDKFDTQTGLYQIKISIMDDANNYHLDVTTYRLAGVD